MNTAESILLVGSMLHLLISMLAAFFMYWQRVARPDVPAQRYALVSHKVSLWNGFLLAALFVALPHTGYQPQVSALLAASVLLSTLLSDLSNIRRWLRGVEDRFRQEPEWQMRTIGLVHTLDLVVIAAFLLGVARTALGI